MPIASSPSRIVANTECVPPATAATAVPPASSARPLTVPIRALRRSSTTTETRQDSADAEDLRWRTRLADPHGYAWVAGLPGGEVLSEDCGRDGKLEARTRPVPPRPAGPAGG